MYGSEAPVYGAVAADHLERPRNLGQLDAPGGVGRIEEAARDTQVTIYVRVLESASGEQVVCAARFRAFGCGGCIITGSMVTELVLGRSIAEAATIDEAAVLHALDHGLPPDQQYCAELAVRALRLAISDATANA
ncbi:MAG: iron-sulfur cluster assembly scaffold protein [Chloroflexota bacterium]